jgi:hypothetical protein
MVRRRKIASTGYKGYNIIRYSIKKLYRKRQVCRLFGTTRHLIGPGACASKLGSITGLSEL